MLSRFLRAFLAFGLFALFGVHCARLGDVATTFSEQSQVPAQFFAPGAGKPGMDSGGPAVWSFWVKSRTAVNEALLGSFTPYYKVDAARLAVSQHFVFYRDITALTPPTTIDNAQAAAVLATLEAAYAKLKSVYGGGHHPYANNNARIVILAYDIQDDYATTHSYVGGYFSPRDLYSNDFTTALFTNPVAIQQYAGAMSILGGYSNELSLVHYDLNPGYKDNPAQVNDIVIHELSHLFSYSNRVMTRRLTNNDLWISEGLAENAPHVTHSTAAVVDLRLTQLGSPTSIPNFQQAPQLTDFAKWASSIVAYMQSNLFFAYLRHRAELATTGGGDALVQEIIEAEEPSIAGVDTAIGAHISSKTFEELYTDYAITTYLMQVGIPVDPTNGLNNATVDPERFKMSKVQIGDSKSTVDGVAIKAKYHNGIPFNYEAPLCSSSSTLYGLNPNSYIIFRHRFGDPFTDPTADTRTAQEIADGVLPLKYVVNVRSENSIESGSPPLTSKLYTFDAGQSIDFGALGIALYDVVHVIAINPNKSGACRTFMTDGTKNFDLILNRNHSRWVGYSLGGVGPSPDYWWRNYPGARWMTNQDGTYQRPDGIAAFAGGSYGTNFLYVTDYLNMSVQRLNMDTGEALGRLGSSSLACPSTASPWTQSTNRFVNLYCAHAFNAPRGIHADSAHTLFIADTENHRIVKYNSAGAYVGWIGRGAGLDTWQSEGTEMTPNALLTAGAYTDPRMFVVPMGVLSNTANDELIVVDYGTRRVTRRSKATGGFIAYIGNGHDSWETSTASQSPDFGSAAGEFTDPRGAALAGGKLYIVDSGNHRIVRVDEATGNSTGWIGDGDGWKSMATPAPLSGSRSAKYFNSPYGIAADSTYLYIADRNNDRVSRWEIATGNFAGWIGHGRIGWEMSADAPASDPYAGVSYYPGEYYAEPQSIQVVSALQKGTRNDYLFITSIYNGRVTRVNLSCVNNPTTDDCDPTYPLP